MDAIDYVGTVTGQTNRILSAPLIGRIDAVHLFLTLGVVMLSVLVWTRVLAHIKG